MEIKNLKKFAEESEKRLCSYYNKESKELINMHALKIGEESGELFEQILSYNNIQRKEKKINKEEIGEEIADVILATAVLAHSLGIDIEKEITEKMKKNMERLN